MDQFTALGGTSLTNGKGVVALPSLPKRRHLSANPARVAAYNEAQNHHALPAGQGRANRRTG